MKMLTEYNTYFDKTNVIICMCDLVKQTEYMTTNLTNVASKSGRCKLSSDSHFNTHPRPLWEYYREILYHFEDQIL